MCLYVRDLNPQESRQLTRVLKTSRTVTYMRRAQVVAFSGQGMRVQEISERLFLHEEYVRQLIRRFNSGSFEALRPSENERLHRRLTLRAAQAARGTANLSVWKEEADSTDVGQQFTDQMRRIAQAQGRDHYETTTGFTVHGGLRGAVAGGGAAAEPFADGEVTHIRLNPSGTEEERSILLEFESGLGSVLAIEPGFIGTVVLEGDRVVSVSYNG